MPAGPGWLGVGTGPSHMVRSTWAWRGSDSWAVGSRRWPELCSSQPALGLGAASCSRLRQFVGGWMRFGQPVGGTPAKAGAIRQGRRCTPSTQIRRIRPGRPWPSLLLWSMRLTLLANKTLGHRVLLNHKVKPYNSLCLLIPTAALLPVPLDLHVGPPPETFPVSSCEHLLFPIPSGSPLA
jgi:hypothetical protein